MSKPTKLSPISIREYWTLLKPVEQRNVRAVAIDNALRCEVCNEITTGAIPLCYFCGITICATCARSEIWFEKPITTCKICYEYHHENGVSV